MALALRYEFGPGRFSQALKQLYDPMAAAATAAVRETADEIRRDGRRVLRAAFPHGKARHVVNSFIVRVEDGGDAVRSLSGRDRARLLKGNSIDAVAHAYHIYGYFAVFEAGARIGGKPLIWIPAPLLPSTIGGLKMTPKNFIKSIGRLHKIDGPRGPMLVGSVAGSRTAVRVTLANLRAANGGGRGRSRLKTVENVPMFFGVSSIALRRRLDLKGVYARAAVGLRDRYFRNLVAAVR